MNRNEWFRVLRWGAVFVTSSYLLLAVGLASVTHSLAQMAWTYRFAEWLYQLPMIPTWYRWVPHESRLGDFSLLRDVFIVNQFPTPMAMMIVISVIGGIAMTRIRQIRAHARYRQSVAYDEKLREEYRSKQDVIVNVPDRSEEMAQLKSKLEHLEQSHETLLTVLSAVGQRKEEEPPPRKRSIGFVNPEEASPT